MADGGFNQNGKYIEASKRFKQEQGTYVDGMTWQPCRFDETPTQIITQSDKRLVNTYRSPTKLVPDGDDSKIPMFMELVEHILPNTKERNIYLDHQAYTMQEPDKKINWQVLLMGATRIGKDMSLKPMAWYFGDMYKDVDPDDAETNKWGDIQAQRKVIVYQEVFRPKDRAFTNSLKTQAASTGGGMVTFNLKGGSQIEQLNVSSIYAMSNFHEALHLDEDDGRWLVLSAMDIKQKSNEFYKKLYDWLMYEDGNEAVVKWLLARDLSHFTPGRLPLHTDAKKTLIDDSRSDVYRKLEDMMHDQKLLFKKDIAVIEVGLVKDYMEAMGRRRLNEGILRSELKQLGLKAAKGRARSTKYGGDLKKTVYLNPNFIGEEPKKGSELWDSYAEAKINTEMSANNLKTSY